MKNIKIKITTAIPRLIINDLLIKKRINLFFSELDSCIPL